MAEVETEPQKTRPKKPKKTAEPIAQAAEPAGKEKKPPKSLTFFDRVAHIEKPDWGTRAQIRLYRLEPIIDRLRGSDTKFVTVYHEPVDESKIKVDWGSGRYRLYLTYKQAGAKEGKELDSVEIDILDQSYPPKIPPGEWVEDPRNKKWIWAKQFYDAQQPPPQRNPGDPVEMLRVLNEVQDSAIARSGSSKETVSPLEYLRMGKEMATPVKATEDSTLKAVMDLTQMMLNKSMEESRELRAEMRAMRERPQAPPVDPLQMLTVTIEKLTPVVERLFPNLKKAGEEVVEKAVRSRMGSWQEFFAPVLPGVVDLLKPVVATVAQGILMSSQTNPGTPLNGTAKTGAVQPHPASNTGTVADLLNFITPVMIGYVRDETDGGAFADWLEAGWGQEKLDQVRAATIDQMIAFLQRSHWWNNKGKGGTEPSLAEMQPQLKSFLQEFMSWSPDAAEDEETGPEAPVIDLMAETVETI